MTITINNGSSLLIFFAIIFAVVILLMILRPGQNGQKILSIVIIIVSFSVVYYFFGRPQDILINESGIHSDVYGKINIEWSEVIETEIIDNYSETGWKPSVKINGSGMIGFRSGRFRLSNGEQAKVLTQKSEDAVVFRTNDELYLFAVNEQDKLIEIASKYVEF